MEYTTLIDFQKGKKAEIQGLIPIVFTLVDIKMKEKEVKCVENSVERGEKSGWRGIIFHIAGGKT